MSKIIIFGANGFIGKHLVQRLSQTSDHKIVAFGRFSDYQRGAVSPLKEYPNVQIVAGDFFNRSEVAAVLDGADYVFHLISTTTPATSNDDPFIDVQTNVLGSIELFELCAERNVKKIIFLSSGGTVYGDINSDAITEQAIPQPRSPYGIGKLTIEHYLRYFKFTSKLDYTVYRVANPYGPGQNIYGKQGVIPIFMHKFLTGQPITIFGTGDMVRDYIYVEDLANMIVESYARINHHDIYNLGSGKGVTVNQIIKAIETCSGHSVEKNYLPAPPTFLQKSVLSVDRYIGEFKIRPTTSLDNGIKKTWEYVKEIS